MSIDGQAILAGGPVLAGFLGDALLESPEDGFVLTREGYLEMQRELNEIATVKRPQVVDRIREARDSSAT